MGEAERIKKLLEKLDELKKSGVFTEEEYVRKKELLLEQLRRVERKPPLKTIQLLSILIAVIIIFVGIVVAVTPIKIPTSYITTAQTLTYIESSTTLEVPIIEKSKGIIEPGYILAIKLGKYSLNKLPSSAILYAVTPMPTTTVREAGTIPYYATFSTTFTALMPVTTTKTIYLTDMILEYNNKMYRLLENEPSIMGKISASKGIIDFLLLDEENYMKLMQQSSYQPIYTISNVRTISEFEFKPPPPEKISGNEVYFVFLLRGNERAEIEYEVNAVWKVIEKAPTTISITLYTTSEYVGTPLIEVGISIILLGIILLVIFRFWRRIIH
jgi:hypothetical protein